MPPIDLRPALALATAAALRAGDLIRAEAHRGGGPRQAATAPSGRALSPSPQGDAGDAHATVDEEAEQLIRQMLTHDFPTWGYLGEESGGSPLHDGIPHWLVDPNDGTAGFLRGERACSVSIALILDGVPVLGVVYAPCYPDDDGDLLTWAEGCGPLQRNGKAVRVDPCARALRPSHVVLVSRSASKAPEANLRCCAPARFRALNSVAYRLALVAAGEAEACATPIAPRWLDVAGGHALLRSRGAEMATRTGDVVRYLPGQPQEIDGCFGGALEVCRELARRPWHEVLDPLLPGRIHVQPAVQPLPRTQLDPGLLRRAQGALLGQLAGDALGSLVEFQTPAQIAQAYPHGPRELEDGGTWDLIAGQPTDDSEMALALAHSLVARGQFVAEHVFESYRAWYHSHPFDIGGTTSAALARKHPSEPGTLASSQANGALMRACPLGIAGTLNPGAAAAAARLDAALTHPNEVCAEANVEFVSALAAGIRGEGPEAMYRAAMACSSSLTRATLERAASEPPADFLHHQGWVLLALHNAFYRLLHATTFEEAIVDTVRGGGDTDTNAAIAGALLGAALGRDAIPARWTRLILSCRPAAAYTIARRPRPATCWPTEALRLAELLLVLPWAEVQEGPPAAGSLQ